MGEWQSWKVEVTDETPSDHLDAEEEEAAVDHATPLTQEETARTWRN